MSKLTKISLHRVASVHLCMFILVEDILVDSSTAKQEYIAVVRDRTLC